jgi:hypothetical protein
MKPKFISIDLAIISGRPLKALRDEFESLGAEISFYGKTPRGYLLAIEPGPFQMRRNAGKDVTSLARTFEALSPTARKLWDGAKTRTFDFGVAGIDASQTASLCLSPAAVKQIAALNGTLAFTSYRPEPGFHQGSKPKAQRADINPAQGNALGRTPASKPPKP